MIDVASAVFPLPDGYKENVMEREKLESTEFGHHIAIPHPLNNYYKEDFIVIARLDKPIVWKNQKAEIIFLCNITDHRKTDWFMNKIAVLLGNENICQNLLKTDAFEEFVSEFEKIKE